MICVLEARSEVHIFLVRETWLVSQLTSAVTLYFAMEAECSTSLMSWCEVRNYSELLPSLNVANWLTIMHEIFELIWLLNGKIE